MGQNEERSKVQPQQVADRGFFGIFLPRELDLVKERFFSTGEEKTARGSLPFLGIYAVNLELLDPSPRKRGPSSSVLGHDLLQIVTSATRFADIPGQLGELELLSVVREVFPEDARGIAKRMLTIAARSKVLGQRGHRVRVGYVLYPLSTQPDLAPGEWSSLLELAQALARRGEQIDHHTGHGLVRGPQMGSPTMPEIDLISLAQSNLPSLTRAELLRFETVTVDSDAE
jgi:hypothetical protein